ncbi:MFS transporter [Candidatus Odyssella thessalonicensis]|uniref:MFS transporter n=1 Tax=Candidatus Odyssella thessalonicensis TaxID=84647 RepID=UPI000225AF1E|nr:MFS transporter [Candidatus Odyssella thessalonicensis]
MAQAHQKSDASKLPVESPPQLSNLNSCLPQDFFLSKAMKTTHKEKKSIPSTVWMIGLIMCLINISYIVIYSLSALYLNTSLGVDIRLIGILEGSAEAISFIMKLFAGVISDYFRRRKPIMVIGYFMTVISKPMMAISANFYNVFAARLLERIGNGIQATPRDAIVGDVAPVEQRGASFGLMRSLGTAGSFLGGGLGFLAMWYTANNFQQVFWLASIPAVVAFTLLVIYIKEPQTHIDNDGKVVALKKSRRPIKMADLLSLGKNYWTLMIIVFIFMSARFSETLMVLYSHNSFGLDKTYAPLIMSLYNLTYSFSSYPSGVLADKYGRKSVMIFGTAALVLSDFFMYTASGLPTFFVGVMIWGIQLGIVHNMFVSLITDYAHEDVRGTAIGTYYLIAAIGSFAAGAGGGFVSHYFGIQTIFLGSLLIGLSALGAMMVLLPWGKKPVVISAKTQ